MFILLLYYAKNCSYGLLLLSSCRCTARWTQSNPQCWTWAWLMHARTVLHWVAVALLSIFGFTYFYVSFLLVFASFFGCLLLLLWPDWLTMVERMYAEAISYHVSLVTFTILCTVRSDWGWLWRKHFIWFTPERHNIRHLDVNYFGSANNASMFKESLNPTRFNYVAVWVGNENLTLS